MRLMDNFLVREQNSPIMQCSYVCPSYIIEIHGMLGHLFVIEPVF